ncbi:hypothetical protein LCGC14_1818850, partial [marine sediment metagenome]
MAEPKAPPKQPDPPAEPNPDQALADAIEAGQPIVYTDRPGGSVSPASPPDASAEKGAKTKGDGEPPPEKKDGKPPEAKKVEPPASKEKKAVEKSDGEPPEEGDEDPLAKAFEGLKPHEVVHKLLEDGTIGPILQGWSDRAGDAQSASAVEQERGGIADEARGQAEDNHWDEHFGSMSEEEIGEELAKDSKAAIAYSRYQQRQQAPPELDPTRVAETSKLYGYAIQLATYDKMVKESELSDKVKANLKAENFTNQGPDGIISYGGAIYAALIEEAAEVKANELLEERWETYQQEHLAETDGERPPMGR